MGNDNFILIFKNVVIIVLINMQIIVNHQIFHEFEQISKKNIVADLYNKNVAVVVQFQKHNWILLTF